MFCFPETPALMYYLPRFFIPNSVASVFVALVDVFSLLVFTFVPNFSNSSLKQERAAVPPPPPTEDGASCSLRLTHMFTPTDGDVAASVEFSS